jgi:hypothetical protein
MGRGDCGVKRESCRTGGTAGAAAARPERETVEADALSAHHCGPED